jgi:hypothetical protein
MQSEPMSHPAEEAIESYSRNSLPEEEVARLEEHLLVCEFCRDRISQADAYVSAIRAAARRLPAEVPRPRRRILKFAAAMAAAMSLVLVAWVGVRTGRVSAPLPAMAVDLAANRGAIEAHAPAGRPLLLRLDLEGLPDHGGAFPVEIVNAAGGKVWRGRAPAGSPAHVSVAGLVAGIYFVRVSTGSGELLREYGLEVGGK